MGKKVYEYSCVGSNLHILLDDWNIRDSDIKRLKKEAIPKNYHEASPAHLQHERECLHAFEVLNIRERVIALALQEGFLT